MHLLVFLLLILAFATYAQEQDVVYDVVEPRIMKRRLFVPLGPLRGTVRKPKRSNTPMRDGPQRPIKFCEGGDLFITGCFCCGEWLNHVCQVNPSISCASSFEQQQPDRLARAQHPLLILMP